MGDFVVWLSKIPPPEPIRQRWNWSASKVIGIRRSRHTNLGKTEQNGAELVFVGHGRGERGNRHFPPCDPMATRLLTTLQIDGIRGLDRHLGPMAGVLVEQQGRRVLVWRDRFGRHPIQMIRLSKGWVVTTSPSLSNRLSSAHIRWSNVSKFIQGTQTTTDADVYTDLFRIRPAEAVRFGNHQITARHRWWQPHRRSVDHPVARMSSVLHQIGALYGNIPHIIALSAGIDSATLAALAARRHPKSHAVTFTDPGSPRDEGPQASEVADHLRLRWTPFSIGDHWPLSRLDDHRFPLAWGPGAHPDFAWKMPCHRWLRRRHQTLPIIYGNGSDDVLWIPPKMWLKNEWHRRDWQTLGQAFSHLSFSDWIRPGLSAFVDELQLRPVRAMLPQWPESTPLWQRPETWFDTAIPNAPREMPESLTERFYQLRLGRLDHWRWERAMRSLAYEARRTQRPIWTPFLDAEFWELSLNTRPTDLVEGGRQKALLRSTAAHFLPENCVQRPKIGGFDPLVERGLADKASHRIYRWFARPQLAQRPAFDNDAFLRAYEAYRRGPTSQPIRGSWAIWRTVATELWLRQRHPVLSTD